MRAMLCGGCWLGLVGCASGVDGTWEGQCDTKSAGGSESYEILALDLVDRGGEITGAASVQPDWFAAPSEGTVSGTREGREVALEAAMGDLTQGFFLTFEGTLEGDRLEGTCGTEVSQGACEDPSKGCREGLASGSAVLERVDTSGDSG